MVFVQILLGNIINSFLNAKYSNVPHVTKDLCLYYSFPYFGQQSNKMQTDILKVLNKYFIKCNFRIVLVNKFTIGNFFNFKDKLPLSMLSSVVYHFSCANNNCASGAYVGMTSRNLYKRVAEHAGRSFRTGVPLTQPPHSSIREHTSSNLCNSPININNFKIINSSSNPTDLRILESLHIFKLKPPLNNSNSSFPLQFL